MMTRLNLYRYINYPGSTAPSCVTLYVTRETRCFYYVIWRGREKRVAKRAQRPWAYTTKRAAAESFAMRKFRQIERCRKDIECARAALVNIGQKHPGIDVKEPPEEWFQPWRPFNGEQHWESA